MNATNSIHYSPLGAAPISPEERHQRTSSSVLNWNTAKLALKILLAQGVPLAVTIAGGLNLYFSINNERNCFEKAGCERLDFENYDCSEEDDKYNECLRTAQSAIGITFSIVGGFTLLSSVLTVPSFISTWRSSKNANTDDNINRIRNTLINSQQPVSLESLGGSTIVTLGIFPEDRVEELNNLNSRYNCLISSRNSIGSRRIYDTVPDVQALDREEENLKDVAIKLDADWKAFQESIIDQIPNPGPASIGKDREML